MAENNDATDATCKNDMHRFPSPDPRDYEPPQDYGMTVVDGERVSESAGWPKFMRERTVVISPRLLQRYVEAGAE